MMGAYGAGGASSATGCDGHWTGVASVVLGERRGTNLSQNTHEALKEFRNPSSGEGRLWISEE